jgi:hypothetical protein
MRIKYIAMVKKYLSFAFFFAFALSLAGCAHAAASEPVIKTSGGPNNQSIFIAMPQDYSGSVSAVYKDGKWQTVTTPYTKAQVAQMNAGIEKRIVEQETAMRAFMKAQDDLFRSIFGINW